jgi:ribosomal subunit interface protein
MSLRVSGKNMDIGEALRAHVLAQLNGIALKYAALPLSGHVVIEPEGSGFRADCTLHLNSGATLQADAKAQDPYLSFDRASDRIEKRLRRYKKKLVDHHARNTVSLAQERESEIPPPMATSDEENWDLSPAVIVEPFSNIKSMSVSHAVMELDTSNVSVVIFRHARDGRPNIVYRRPDGNIGWIDPARL